VTVEESVTDVSTVELVRGLRREDPRVFVGSDALDEHQFTVNPMCLTDDEADYVVERIRANLGVGSEQENGGIDA
jgi:L-seryl-tRNA(Ser) seleniumtransferase